MNMNFDSIANIKPTSQNLKAWHIYDKVDFKGVSDPITGPTKDGGTWKAWDLTFQSPEGIYRERIFEPNEKATKRTELPGSNGGKITLPSNLEYIQQVVMQILDAYTTDGRNKLSELAAAGKLHNIEFSQFMTIIKALTKNPIKASDDNNIQLKLQGRNSNGAVYAKLPNARINREGEVWLEKFVGKGLTMTAYELNKANEMSSVKPTNMDSVDAPQDDLSDLMGNL